jgi:hypothetical protein
MKKNPISTRKQKKFLKEFFTPEEPDEEETDYDGNKDDYIESSVPIHQGKIDIHTIKTSH